MLRAACALSSCDPTLDLSLLSRSPRLDDDESPLPPLVGVAAPVPDLCKTPISIYTFLQSKAVFDLCLPLICTLELVPVEWRPPRGYCSMVQPRVLCSSSKLWRYRL